MMELINEYVKRNELIRKEINELLSECFKEKGNRAAWLRYRLFKGLTGLKQDGWSIYKDKRGYYWLSFYEYYEGIRRKKYCFVISKDDFIRLMKIKELSKEHIRLSDKIRELGKIRAIEIKKDVKELIEKMKERRILRI